LIVTARSRLSAAQSFWLSIAAFGGIFISILYGYLLGRPFPSLHSVGHINQVAIYLGVATAWFAAILYTARQISWRIFAVGCGLIAMIYWTFSTESRNALFGVLITVFSLPIIDFFVGDRKRAVSFGLSFALLLGVLYFQQPTALKRQLAQTSINQSIVDDARKSLWNSSWMVAKDAPMFGYGVGYFRDGHTPRTIERLVSREGSEFKWSDYVWTNHAHNLTLNWLVERGWLASVTFGLWLVHLLIAFIRKVTTTCQQEIGIFSSWVGASVLTSTLMLGIGNTSWHHEHGLLAAVVIGFAWSAANFPSSVQPREPD
jgi:O-antigen ligase